MNPGFISLIIFSVIIGLLVLIFVSATRNSRPYNPPIHKWELPDKGQIGENVIASILNQFAKSDDKIINNILLFNKENGKSSQIDHIFICDNGVFVIETKNYSGHIYGSDSAHEWKQYLGETITNFPSPVKQNATHIYLIKKILKNVFPVRGIIVFVQGNIEHIDSASVYTCHNFCTAFSNPPLDTPLTIEEKNHIYQTIIDYKNCYPVTEEMHLENIQKMKWEIDNNICPRCGGQLILRNGKYGSFYGCSNYPKCKFTKQDK